MGNLPATYSLRQVEDFDRLDLVGRFEAEDSRVEIQLGFVGTDDVLCFAKPVLLTGERHVRHGHAALFERLQNQLRLIRRHDFVFEALQQDHGADEFFEVEDR